MKTARAGGFGMTVYLVWALCRPAIPAEVGLLALLLAVACLTVFVAL